MTTTNIELTTGVAQQERKPADLLTASRLLVARQLRATVRQPVWLVSGLMTPLLYLALFAPLLSGLGGGLATTPGYAGGTVVDGFMPGMLVMFAFGCGTGTGWVVINELNAGVIERLRVSPVSRLAILLGTTIKDAIMFVIPAVIVVGVAAIFGFQVHPLGLLATFVLLAMLTATVSAAVGAVGLTVKQIGSIAAVVTTLQLPLTLLAGILLPMSLGPGWLRGLAHVNPLYYATEAARQMCSGLWGQAAWVGFAVIGVLLVASLAWGNRVYNKVVA